jgi:hypothetical protein
MRRPRARGQPAMRIHTAVCTAKQEKTIESTLAISGAAL